MDVPEPLHDSGWNLRSLTWGLKQGHLRCHQAAQDFIQINLKNLGLHDFPRQPVPMLDCSSGKRFPLYLDKMAPFVIFLEILCNSVFSATWYFVIQTNNCLLILNSLLIYNAVLWLGKKEFSLRFDCPIFLVLSKLCQSLFLYVILLLEKVCDISLTQTSLCSFLITHGCSTIFYQLYANTSSKSNELQSIVLA